MKNIPEINIYENKFVKHREIMSVPNMGWAY